MKVLAVLGLLAVAATAAKLPQYFPKCKKSDPNLSRCVKESTIKGWPSFNRGDASAHIVPQNPLEVPVMIVIMNGLKINFTNSKIYGLENMELSDVQFDLGKRRMEFDFYVDRVALIGHYEIKGRILILPITGNGHANITYVGGKYTYKIDYNLLERRGKRYIEVSRETFKYELQRSYIRFENLFNGDKQLGEDMNSFLDENWREIDKDLGSHVGDALGEVVTGVVQAFFRKVPYDEFFDE